MDCRHGITKTGGFIGGGLLFMMVLQCGSCSMNGTDKPVSRDGNEQEKSGAASSDWFIEVSQEAGLDFVHFNGMTGQFYFPEIKGNGVGLFDYDNDGDLDVYIVQGKDLGPDLSNGSCRVDPSGMQLVDRLFRCDLSIQKNGERTIRFTDVTEMAGFTDVAFGLGVTAADYDNDGWIDIYVTNFTDNKLWRNNGDGTFSDMTVFAGVEEPRYSTSAAFLDFDQDGHLDLYVANYVDFSYETHRPCYSSEGNRDYCGPQCYNALPDRLFRNLGDGRFEDVSEKSRIIVEYGSGLGVVAGDFNLDGLLDIYVANDNLPNLLWVNQGDGSFVDDALMSGCAVSLDGVSESSMGVDAGDFDNDGDEDIILAHLMNQTNTLYVNEDGVMFSDTSTLSGLGATSIGMTGFGAVWIDYDNDGDLDLSTANGAVMIVREQRTAGSTFPYAMKNQLFRNDGEGTFVDVSQKAGVAFELKEVSRGSAMGDIDNDGDSDLLVSNTNGPVRLLINQIGNKSHWLGVRLVSEDGRRDMLGAWAMLQRKGKPTLHRRVRAAASYMSSNDPRIIFGLGEDREPVSLEVRWVDGSRERWENLEVDRYITLARHSGQPVVAQL